MCLCQLAVNLHSRWEARTDLGGSWSIVLPVSLRRENNNATEAAMVLLAQRVVFHCLLEHL